MPKRKTTTTTRVVAWWLGSGELECPHCGQPYAYEVEFRCPECDGSCCPHCKKRHPEDRTVCAGCLDGCEQPEVESNGR